MTLEATTASFIRASEDKRGHAKSNTMAEISGDAPSEFPKLSVSHEGEHHNDFGDDIRITRSTYLFALCAALNSVNLGYDIGTSTSAGSFLFLACRSFIGPSSYKFLPHGLSSP